MILINKYEMRYGENDGIIYLEVPEEDYALVIINRKSHPCVYVSFPGIEHLSSYDQASRLWDVHGGFTFLGNLSYSGLEGLWLGWDYAHYNDYLFPSVDDFVWEGKKWKLKELIKDGLSCLVDIAKLNPFREGE